MHRKQSVRSHRRLRVVVLERHEHPCRTVEFEQACRLAVCVVALDDPRCLGTRGRVDREDLQRLRERVGLEEHGEDARRRGGARPVLRWAKAATRLRTRDGTVVPQRQERCLERVAVADGRRHHTVRQTAHGKP